MSSPPVTVARRFDAVFGDGATALAAALVVAGLVNLAVQGLAVAWLADSAQRALARLLILLFACSVPADALFVSVVRSTVRRRAAGTDEGLDWRRDAGRAGGVAGAVGLALALTIEFGPHELGLRASYSAVFIFAYMLLLGVGVVPRGVLLGTGRYRPVGVAAMTGTAVRLATFAIAVRLGAGLGGALLATILGKFGSTVVLVTAARVGRARRALLDIRWTSLTRPLLALGGLWALVAVEVVLAHRYIVVASSDAYATETAIARILLFILVIPQALVVLALARFALGGRIAADALRCALRIGMAATVIAVAVISAMPSLGLARLFPGHPPVPVALLLTVGVASCAVGLLTILVAYCLVRGLPCAGTIWGAVAVMVAVAWLLPTTPTTLVTIFVLVVLAALTRLLVGPALIGTAAEHDVGERRAVLPDDGGLDLTVVVPFFNPGGSALRDHVLELLDTLEREGIRFEILAVSDGSTDGSEQLVRDLMPRGLRTLVLDHGGKGAALHAGLEAGQGRYLGFIDADGDIPAEQWHHFLALIRMYNADMIVGSKRHPLSELHYPTLRRVYSRIFQLLVRALFRVDVTDTQTGIKVFRREMLADVLPLLVETGFVFDLELLAVARRRRWRRVIEAPVRIEHRFHSTISLRSVFRMLHDTCVLALRMHVMRSYDTPVEPAVVTEPRASLVASSSWPSAR